MYLRLIAKVSSGDEAQKVVQTLKSQGVTVASDYDGTHMVVLTFTTESGCDPNTRMFHEANTNEVRLFAKWALETKSPLALTVHRAAQARAAKGAKMEMTTEMVNDLANCGPSFFPVCQAIYLMATRNGELAELRERLAKLILTATNKDVACWKTPTQIIDDVFMVILELQQQKKMVAAMNRRIVELEQQLATVSERVKKVAHQRNTVVRKFRRIRKIVNA